MVATSIDLTAFIKAEKGKAVCWQRETSGTYCHPKRHELERGCRGDKPPIPWRAYFGKAGWKERWARLLGGVRFFYTLAKCKKHLKMDSQGFKADAIRLYTDINRMTAAGDRTGLCHVTPPAFFHWRNALGFVSDSVSKLSFF
jgi:hypothetical protein